MGLLDDISAEETAPGHPCGVASILARLDPPDRDELTVALASDFKGSAIAKALASRGHRISGYTIQRHRRNECRCSR